MSIVIGLVVEGKNDFPVIEAAIRAELSTVNISDILFRRLQPDRDATGDTESGGWAKVVGWLMDNAGDRVETYFAPLFESQLPCDFIVVHLDSDIYKDCLRKANIAAPLSHDPIEKLLTLLRSALDQWFDLRPDRKGRVSYAIPVFKTENWLMVSRSDCPLGEWNSLDAKARLRALFDSTKYRSFAAMCNAFIVDLSNDSSAAHRAKSYRIFARDLESKVTAIL